ncbi:hypothetical protein ACS0TY_014023 [Phlomoides rotata]
MAISQIQFRSISLPSRLHDPINSTGFEAELEKLKSWKISSLSKTSPITSDSIQSGLLALADIYNSVTQEGKSVEESLESSVELLDSCNTIRELLQMLRESVQALHSALRRKGLDSDSTIKNDISSYLCIRKKMNKCISKSLRALKTLENNNLSVTGLTIDIFKCILVFFSSSIGKSNGWNLVSKLMVTKSGKDHGVITEVGCVDLALNDVQRSLGRSDSKSVDRQMVERSLHNLESCIQGIEGGVERLFRQLLKSRVALLNILTDH